MLQSTCATFTPRHPLLTGELLLHPLPHHSTIFVIGSFQACAHHYMFHTVFASCILKSDAFRAIGLSWNLWSRCDAKSQTE